jgi:hypothetical protein
MALTDLARLLGQQHEADLDLLPVHLSTVKVQLRLCSQKTGRQKVWVLLEGHKLLIEE